MTENNIDLTSHIQSHYNEGMVAPYTAASCPPFISNTVPFQSHCYQTPYYSIQPQNVGLPLYYPSSSENGTRAGPPPLYNSYCQTIPRSDKAVYQQSHYGQYPESPASNESSPHFKVPNPHNSQQFYDSSFKGSNSLPIRSQELQASAKIFVPREERKNSDHQDDLPSSLNLTADITSSLSNINISNQHNNSSGKSNLDTGSNERNHDNGTRPKKASKDVSQRNKNYWSDSQNWQRPNVGNSAFNNEAKNLPSNSELSRAPQQNFIPYHMNSRYQKNQRYQRNPHFNNQAFGYNNGSRNFYRDNNFHNRNNQRRMHPTIRKTEWKRSNDSHYYQDQNNGEYLHNSGRNSSQCYAGNNTNIIEDKKGDLKERENFQSLNNSWNPRNKKRPMYQRKNFTTENKVPQVMSARRGETERKEMSKEISLNNANEKTQRENLVENLSKAIYECMVCCEVIRQQHSIWSCMKCYNCFHLNCIKKWAQSSQEGETGWRCPACQNLNSKIPNGYFCYCKKMRDPKWNYQEIPHSCGEICGKKREIEWCVHKCNILCHPGPCPDCSAFISRSCQCGKNKKNMKCSNIEANLCGDKCSHVLNCGVHFCEKLCHIGDCEPCTTMKVEECFCQKENRTVECNPETASRKSYSCNTICNKTLSCGQHTCEEVCHVPPCKPCERAVETVKTCPCGKTDLSTLYKESIKIRESCRDPIPTCENLCSKQLKCGTPGFYHICQSKCHEGICPPCPNSTAVKCRCGSKDKKIACAELLTKADEVTCEKQCKKLRQCGRHKCGLKCCIDIDHICSRICGRSLNCRSHKCQEPCHRGNCPRCWETSFDELTCHCGASVLDPPIPCGTEPPTCQLPCRRPQACNHSVAHTCHPHPKCPPCTTLISKPCFGNHTIMKATPCYVKAISCGEQCAKILPCKVHRCQKVCHDMACTKGSSCGQNCTEIRVSCGHTCNNPCHSGPCPNTLCKEMVTVTCICGNRKVKMACSENERQFKSMATSKIASELYTLNSGGSINISQIFSGMNKSEKTKRLECNDDCGLLARNRQLALALQITNPDARDTLGDGRILLFSDSIKDEAKKDLPFAQMIHDTLNDLVLKAKESKQKSRSHSFPPMNRNKRRFIHEYSKYFGCQSESYDEEPKMNVVVTAYKALSRLPPTSIVSVIRKEQGQRKVPAPVLSRKSLVGEESQETQMQRLEKNTFEKSKESNEGNVPTTTSVTAGDSSSKKQQSSVIDYFDFS